MTIRMETMQGLHRTHGCGTISEQEVGKEVVLCGWVERRRDHGGLIFLDLRDRSGVVQVVASPDHNVESFHKAEDVRNEYVLCVRGTITKRDDSAINPNLPTGAYEMFCEELRVLNSAKTPPFYIQDDIDVDENIRLKYRYLDLRRPEMQRNLILRHKVTKAMRDFFDSRDFLEIETPMLTKSTPEGARDYLVPSRVNAGTFYALPQSPQIFKQILMVAGYEKYFQIVRCFRDEDLRADRQPEFTQIDCEMSFVQQEDVLNTFEGMMRSLFKNILNVEIANPIPRMSWYEAMDKYGSDKPDIRFGMTIHNITDTVKGHGFSVLDDAAYVGSISLPGASEYTRKQLDELTEWVKRPQIGAKGLIYIKLNNDGTIKSSIDKFYTQEDLLKIAKAAEANTGDLILILSGDNARKVQNMLGTLRLEMGGRMGLRDPKIFAPLWVVDFPLLEWDDETSRFYAMPHPFTAPKPEHMDLFYSDRKEDLAKVCANAYDFVLNGTELGGGSIRIHGAKDQKRMFEVLGITGEEAEYKFGFIINAFQYGAPPHGGLAFGFDRICSLFGGCDSIRDFIAFPKNNQGRDVMIDSPSIIDDTQLEELQIKTVVK